MLILKLLQLGEETYLMKAFTIRMKDIRKVRLLISLNQHGNFNFYVSNRLDWNETAIATRYSRRWDIEVWHRESKVSYGLKDCQLRCDEGVSKHLTLSSLMIVIVFLRFLDWFLLMWLRVSTTVKRFVIFLFRSWRFWEKEEKILFVNANRKTY